MSMISVHSLRAHHLLLLSLCSTALLQGCPSCEGGTGSENASNKDMDTSMQDMSDFPEDMGEIDVEDTLAPVVMITSSTSAPYTGQYTLKGSARDDIALEEVTYTLDDGAKVALVTSEDGAFSEEVTLTQERTTITVTATDRAGSSSSQTIEVTREQPPELQAAFTVEGMPWLHEPLIFDASSISDPLGGELTLTWEMGEQGESFTSTHFGHAFHEPGDVVVTLTVTASDGRSAVASRTLTIVEPMSVGVTMLEGRITDEDGFAMPGVEVRLAGSEEILGTSDLRGHYTAEVGQGVPSILTYHKAGWNTQIQRVATSSGQSRALRDVAMARVKEQVVLLDASEATEVSINDGTRLDFPANAFVYEESGEPVEGQLLVEVTPIKPIGDRGVPGFPGSFTALRQGRIPTGLATHGAVDVKLSQGKQKVQLAQGIEAEILIPLATEAAIGQIIDLWSLDERNGLWVWEGTGEVIANPDRSNEKVMRARVSHFSVWNSDEPVLNRPVDIDMTFPAGTGVLDDLHVITHGRSPQGAAIQGGTGAPQQVTTGPDGKAQEKIELPIATDYDTRIEIGSQQGCLYGAVDIEAGAAPDEVLLEVFRTDENAVELEPGAPQTLGFDNDRPWEVAYFDEVPGQYWKVTIEVTDGASVGTLDLLPGCGGTSTARLMFGPDATASMVIAPGAQSRRALIFDADNVDAEVQVTLEALEAPALPTDSALGQQQEIDWQNNSTEERWVYLNREQVAHVALGGDYPPGAGLSFVTPSGEVRQPLRAPFTASSYLFTAAESGWHLFVLNPFAPPTEPKRYTLTLGEVLPEKVVTYSKKDRSSSLSGERYTLARGDIQRYRIHKPGDEILFVSPRRTEDSPSLDSPRLGGQLTLKPAPDTLTPSYAIAEQPSNVELSFYLFDAGLEDARYEVDTEMIERDMAEVLVGSCVDESQDTKHVMLAARAVAEGGLVKLCEGTHEAFDGLRFRAEGIRLRGEVDAATAPQDWPRLQAWQGQALLPVEQQVIGMERVGWELSGSPLALRMDDLDGGMLQLDGVYVTGDLPESSYALRVRGPLGVDWSQTQERPLFRQLVIDVTAQNALQIERFVEVEISDVRVENATQRGIYLSDVASSTLSNVTIVDAKQAIEWGGAGSHNNTLRSIDVTHALSAQGGVGGVPSVFIQDHAPTQTPSTVSTSTMRIEDLFIELGEDGQTGLVVRGMKSNPTRMELDRVFIDGRGLTNTTALQAQQTGTSGTLEVVNSVLKGVTKHAIEVVGAYRFDELRFMHDTLELAGEMVASRRALLTLTDASATTLCTIVNTIFSAREPMSHTAGVDLYQATVSAPLGNLANNLFHQVTFPYARQNVAPFVTPSMADDVAGDPMFVNAMLEVDAMSPAIDAGQTLPEVTQDYHGSPRPSGASVDIGAYEQ